MSARGVSVRTNKPEWRWERKGTTTNTSQPFFPPHPFTQLELPPSPSVSEKLRVPPAANKAIRDGKDADTAAFKHHSEQKKETGREGVHGMGGD